jgi:hypothetical protein
MLADSAANNGECAHGDSKNRIIYINVKTQLLKNTWTIIWKIMLFLILWGLFQAPLLIPFIKLFDKLFPSEWSRLIIESNSIY